MRLKAFALAVAVLVLPLASEAQKAGKLYRVGSLSGHTYGPLFEAFATSLRKFGYRDHQTIEFVVRTAGGDTTLLPQLASEILRAGVDVIVADTTPAAQAASSATRTIPLCRDHCRCSRAGARGESGSARRESHSSVHAVA